MLARLATIINQHQLPVLIGLATQGKDELDQVIRPGVAEHRQQREPGQMREFKETARLMTQGVGQGFRSLGNCVETPRRCSEEPSLLRVVGDQGRVVSDRDPFTGHDSLLRALPGCRLTHLDANMAGETIEPGEPVETEASTGQSGSAGCPALLQHRGEEVVGDDSRLAFLIDHLDLDDITRPQAMILPVANPSRVQGGRPLQFGGHIRAIVARGDGLDHPAPRHELNLLDRCPGVNVGSPAAQAKLPVRTGFGQIKASGRVVPVVQRREVVIEFLGQDIDILKRTSPFSIR